MPDGPLLPPGLETPATVVLADRLERNLASLASHASSHSMSLRPHAKTHKCREIARRQMAHGAVGISVATVAEAEILSVEPGDSVDSVVGDVFVAYPLWPADDLVRRLLALSERVTVSVGVDSAEAAERLAPLAGRVRAVVEVDCGLRRSGALPSEAASVAAAAARAGLDVSGVFTFPGHSYGPGAAEAAARDEAAALAEAAEALLAEGFSVAVRSGGSTPSARYAHGGAVNELRPGVYVFNDAQQVELGSCGFEDVALVVAATVVSHPARSRIVLDAGAKVLGPDQPRWTTGRARIAELPKARVTGLWEHHAVVELTEPAPPLGSVLSVVPNHVCSAVNLVPFLTVVEGGAVVERWEVAARGANR